MDYYEDVETNKYYLYLNKVKSQKDVRYNNKQKYT